MERGAMNIFRKKAMNLSWRKELSDPKSGSSAPRQDHLVRHLITLVFRMRSLLPTGICFGRPRESPAPLLFPRARLHPNGR